MTDAEIHAIRTRAEAALTGMRPRIVFNSHALHDIPVLCDDLLTLKAALRAILGLFDCTSYITADDLEKFRALVREEEGGG